jgi:2'-5' RNA ligase
VLPETLAAVARLGGHPVAGRVVGLTGFPRPSAARLLAAELEPQAHLEGWWASLQGLPGGEDRGFRPHVTVLRFRRPRAFRPSSLPQPVAVNLEPPQLYRSDQTRDGVRYRPVTLD